MRKSTFFIAVSLLAAPLAAQQSPATTDAGAASDTTAAPAAGAAATVPVAAGTAVNDTTGAAVGKIASVSNGAATIDTGTVKAAVPVTSLGQGKGALVLAMTKADLEAAAAKASKPAEVAVGAKVVGPQGNAVGTIAEVNGELVTVQTPTTKVQLPKTAFAAGSDGALAIGMTQAQLEAAAKAAQKPS